MKTLDKDTSESKFLLCVELGGYTKSSTINDGEWIVQCLRVVDTGRSALLEEETVKMLVLF